MEKEIKEKFETMSRLINASQTLCREMGKQIYNLEESYKRNSKDQWKMISDLNKKIEELEEKLEELESDE